MKRNNSKKDSSAKQQTIVLVGNTYRRNVNPIPVIAVKLVLAYMLTVGTVMSFINIYDIPFEFGSAIAQVLLFVTAFMPVFIFIKKRYALPAFAVGAAIVYFFFHKSINESLILFKDYIFIQLDSRLLSTLQYVPVNSHAFLTRTQDFVSGMNTAMLILTCIISFICVLCCYKKIPPYSCNSYMERDVHTFVSVGGCRLFHVHSACDNRIFRASCDKLGKRFLFAGACK